MVMALPMWIWTKTQMVIWIGWLLTTIRCRWNESAINEVLRSNHHFERSKPTGNISDTSKMDFRMLVV